jgi:hypothetical protein
LEATLAAVFATEAAAAAPRAAAFFIVRTALRARAAPRARLAEADLDRRAERE